MRKNRLMKTMTHQPFLRRATVLALAISIFAALTVTGYASDTGSAAGTGIYSEGDLFTDRDLTQEADLTGAISYTVTDGEDIHITQAGVYVLTGTA